MHRLAALLIALCISLTSVIPAAALTQQQRRVIDSGALHYNTEGSPIGSACNLFSSGTNMTESGVFNQAQLDQIALNQPTYEQAAIEHQIPWEMIAVFHARETSLSRDNPSNGQGLYQFVSGAGGPYPTGPVTEEEFLRQTRFMAERVKTDFSQRTPIASNRLLNANPAPEVVKDTFFSYNGRADVYAQQAASLGYDALTQPYEGSPYVMNKADPRRDPAVNTTTWGQIKRDFGPIEYPAADNFGAFVMYAALAGISSSSCDNTTAESVVEIAKQEMALGATTANEGYLKYTGGVVAEWCAYFVSWIFDTAGKPFINGTIPATAPMRAYATERGYYHPKDEATFTPAPGDIVVYDEGLDPYPSHVNIVIAYNPTTEIITTIGGNESDSIKESNNSRSLPAISGYIRIP